MRIGIGIINEVIQKVDIGCGDDGVYLVFEQKQTNDMLCIPLLRSDYLKEFLQIVGKEKLSEVKDVPVRMFVTCEIGVDDSISDELEVVAIGNLLEDKWVVLSSEEEADIVDFDTITEYLGLQEAESVMMY